MNVLAPGGVSAGEGVGRFTGGACVCGTPDIQEGPFVYKCEYFENPPQRPPPEPQLPPGCYWVMYIVQPDDAYRVWSWSYTGSYVKILQQTYVTSWNNGANTSGGLTSMTAYQPGSNATFSQPAGELQGRVILQYYSGSWQTCRDTGYNGLTVSAAGLATWWDMGTVPDCTLGVNYRTIGYARVYEAGAWRQGVQTTPGIPMF